jgi:hypothetical protein
MSRFALTRSRRLFVCSDASVREHPQEVARVELVDRCLRHLFHARLEAGNGVTAAFCVWVIAREQIEVVV